MSGAVLDAVARAHWLAVNAALATDGLEDNLGEAWQDFEDGETGELIGNGDH